MFNAASQNATEMKQVHTQCLILAIIEEIKIYREYLI